MAKIATHPTCRCNARGNVLHEMGSAGCAYDEAARDHKPVLRLVGGKLTCGACDKGVTRRRIAGGKRVFVHHNATGLIRFNGRPR